MSTENNDVKVLKRGQTIEIPLSGLNVKRFSYLPESLKIPIADKPGNFARTESPKTRKNENVSKGGYYAQRQFFSHGSHSY